MSLIAAPEVEVIIIHKLNRLTRSVTDLDKLFRLFDKAGVMLVSLQESLDATTATGRLRMNLLASISQWEREVIGGRTQDTLQHLNAQCKRSCYIVYNNPQVIALMHQLRAADNSYEAIVHHLNEAGIPMTLGRPWQAMVVWGIGKRPQPETEEDRMKAGGRLFRIAGVAKRSERPERSAVLALSSAVDDKKPRGMPRVPKTKAAVLQRLCTMRAEGLSL